MRPIDADRYREEWLKMETFEPMKLLDIQPTLYNIDEVIKELECEIKAIEDLANEESSSGYFSGSVQAFLKAIEIIKCKNGC